MFSSFFNVRLLLRKEECPLTEFTSNCGSLLATHSSTLAWKIPWMEEPGRLQSMGSLGVRHDWVTWLSLFTFMHWRRKWQPTPIHLPGVLQARTLEWVAISFSNAWKWKVKVKSLSRVGLSATPWTAAHQTPPSMGFSRQEYWSGLPLPSPIVGP